MNSHLVVSCLLAIAAVTSANPPSLGLVPITTIDRIPNPSYAFNYAVNDPHTGDNKAQWESRHGDVVKGAYSLVEPDGNIRLVEYTADPVTGFNAVVKRTGPNIHSVGLPVAAPVVAHAPVVAPVVHAPVAPIAPIAPLHTEIITPVIDAPLLAPQIIHPLPALDLVPYHLPPLSPWVHLSGASYGHKGNIVRRWAAGPISLAGKTLTIKTKH
ncbi:cuticle protein 7-like [Pectinophora gossypiella]|uniref:cuticle protein 7-like n=1 Tax=Pectinophora gossypiella TaxID=13191 RepID=UPI00214E4E62|nr:cuticle protein 7-like [Pectinophora gossypiella]